LFVQGLFVQGRRDRARRSGYPSKRICKEILPDDTAVMPAVVVKAVCWRWLWVDMQRFYDTARQF
jgi:hypothetical protein